MAGYSGTPLPQKLGIKPGAKLMLLGAPVGFDETLGAVPEGVELRRHARGTADVVVAFFIDRRHLERRLAGLGRTIFPAGALWLAWPKRASGVATNITEDVVRDVALPRGLVDNKVCAIDATWSGLRFVWRKERRC